MKTKCVFSLLAAVLLVCGCRTAGPTAVQWEYKQVRVADYMSEEDLNALGTQGWILSGFDYDHATIRYRNYVFRRALTSTANHTQTAAGRGSNTLQSPRAGRDLETSDQRYMVRAGGPHTFVPVTGANEADQVRVTFNRFDTGPHHQEIAVFTVANRERRRILLWNVRIQVPSEGSGTDGLGWNTVHDDYPIGTATTHSARLLPGATGEFWVKPPDAERWRVCFLYSKEMDDGSGFSGNYEAVSGEIAR
jgi:hypothetical protein